MRRYLPPSAVNDPVSAWGYTRAMMTKRILTICAVVSAASAAGVAGTSLASAQSYPIPPGAVYSPHPPPYPPGGYSTDYRAPRPMDFDVLEDDDGPNRQSSTALPPPGPVLSPDDPRYGRPMIAPPVYSDRTVPTGPILSPDDPRYGRPAGAPPVYSDRTVPTGPILSPDDPRYGRRDPPPVIYSDRPAGPSEHAYGDNRIPGSGIVYPHEDDRALRPPAAIGPPGNVTGSVQQQSPAQGAQPPQGPDGRPMVLSALPPEEQPDAAPVNLPPNLRRQEVRFPTKEPPGTLIVDTPNTHLYYVLGNGRAIRYGVRVGRDGFTWTGVQKISRGRVAGLASADRDDRAPALSAALHGRRSRQSAGRARDVSRQHCLSHPRHQPAFDDRQVRLLGLHRHAERGRLGPVRSRQGRHQSGRASRWPAAGIDRHRLGRAAARTERRTTASAIERPRHPADRGAAAAAASDGALGLRDDRS